MHEMSGSVIVLLAHTTIQPTIFVVGENQPLAQGDNPGCFSKLAIVLPGLVRVDSLQRIGMVSLHLFGYDNKFNLSLPQSNWHKFFHFLSHFEEAWAYTPLYYLLSGTGEEIVLTLHSVGLISYTDKNK